MTGESLRTERDWRRWFGLGGVVAGGGLLLAGWLLTFTAAGAVLMVAGVLTLAVGAMIGWSWRGMVSALGAGIVVLLVITVAINFAAWVVDGDGGVETRTPAP